MSLDLDRFRAFEDFACSRNGNSLRRRVHAMARHYASSHAAKLDPNWHSIAVRFNEYYIQQQLTHRSVTDKDACRVVFDYRPSRFVLECPKLGHVDLTEEAFQVIPESLFILMRVHDLFKEWPHTLYNPKHEVELIEGRTLVHFENCMTGVVRNVSGEEFDVEFFTGNFGCPSSCDGEIEHYTLERLKQEFEIDGMCCQAVDVGYLPFVTSDGRKLETADDVREEDRRQSEIAERERAEEEAKAAEAEAARRAALSPEERQREDEEREEERKRIEAQAALANRLLPLLPGPDC